MRRTEGVEEKRKKAFLAFFFLNSVWHYGSYYFSDFFFRNISK